MAAVVVAAIGIVGYRSVQTQAGEMMFAHDQAHIGGCRGRRRAGAASVRHTGRTSASTSTAVHLLLPPFALPPLIRSLFLIGLDHIRQIERAELVWIVAVGGAAGGAERLLLIGRLAAYAVPAPHAYLIAAFAGEEILIAQVELFAAEGADFLFRV